MNIKLQLPEGFLDEEVRNDYTISHEMKKVWAVELDLFAEFDRVCKKNGIRYCACGGTMLGAIRHKGFIPWDDDIDVMMLRKDYDKLCAVAEREFLYPYFFQTEYTDRGTLRRHAQLRNSETTGILQNEFPQHYKFNQGIFLDIFPLDNVVENSFLYMLQKYQCRFLLYVSKRASFYSTRYVESQNRYKRIVKGWIYKKMYNSMSHIALVSYKKYEQCLAQYNNRKTKEISQLYWDFQPYVHRDLKDFQPLIYYDFEFLKIPVASNYEHALSKRFGNWQEFVKGGSLHGGVIFDTEKSYKDYFKHNGL